MRLTKTAKRILFITTLIVFLGFCLYSCFDLYKFGQGEIRVSDEASEEVFQSRFMNGKPIPPEVTYIHAVQMYGFGGWGALARFNATDSFITEMLDTDYGFEGTYTKRSCHPVFVEPDFFTTELPGKFEWWKPFNVTSKACYHAYTCIVHDEKFLLVDLDSNQPPA